MVGYGRPADTTPHMSCCERQEQVLSRGNSSTQRYLLVSSHLSDPVPAEAVGALAEKLPTHASYSKVTGWHDAVVGSTSGLDVCCQPVTCHYAPAACLLERLVATENDWGQTTAVLITCGEG